MHTQDIIAQSFQLPNGRIIKNRLFKSAMSEGQGTKTGAPKPELINLYEVWAQGGIGICVTGNVMIDKRYLGEPGNVFIEDESNLETLKKWATAATKNNTDCWVQLNHPGKQSPRGLNKENVAPSAIPFRRDMQPVFATPRALTITEIKEIITHFGNAAAIVKKAGFSGVQIHGAHGYLISQFLSPHHNIRTDEYGGSAENRRRFVLDVYHAMRAKVGNNFPIGIKLNSADFQKGGFSEDESMEAIKALAAAGIDLIEISGGTYEAPEMMVAKQQKESTKQREAYFLDFAEKIRNSIKTPLVVTGGFRSLEGMAAAISSGAVDFVGIARALAVEPDLPNRLLSGQQPLHTIIPRKTGIGMIDNAGILEIKWYADQMKRIGRGEAPIPNESPYKTLFRIGKSFFKTGGKNTKRTRAN